MRNILNLLVIISLSTYCTSCGDNTVSSDCSEGANCEEGNNTDLSEPGSPNSDMPPNTNITEEWVEVPANAGGMGLPMFYVMKYEAKAMLNDESAVSSSGLSLPAEHKPVSTIDNPPWVGNDANVAAAECESLGYGYHLISNPEWLAIAKDIENVGANWTGGSVGSGCLFRGNNGEVTIGDGSSISDSCGYDAATDPEVGPGRDPRAKHTLSNGLEIWDLSANVYEWVDWDMDTVGFQLGPGINGFSDYCTEYGELLSTTCPIIASDYMPGNPAGINPSEYDRDYGLGTFWTSSSPGGAAIRGGMWESADRAGIFEIDLSPTSSHFLWTIGFRCVFRP